MLVYVDTLLCELVRSEANGKISLLGLFGEAILVPSIPGVMSSLAIVQRWRPTTDERPGTMKVFTLELRGPGIEIQGSPMAPPRQTVQVIIPGPPLPLIQVGFQLFGFPVQQQGDYQVLTVIDGIERNRSRFFIGVPTEEQRRNFDLRGFPLEPRP